MTTLYMTRRELIDDLSSAFREQNDLTAMSDTQIIAAWKQQGIHAGTWDWDDIEISAESQFCERCGAELAEGDTFLCKNCDLARADEEANAEETA